MQANANSKTARKPYKHWRVVRSPTGEPCIECAFVTGHSMLTYVERVGGASPVYIEAVVEELNIRINEMLYNLGRIARV